MGLFDSTSNSKNETYNYDQKIGAEGGGVAQRIEASGSTVNISSDEIAQSAIASAQNNLSQTLAFLGDQLTSLYNTVDSRARSAESNVSAAQALAGEVVSRSQETSADAFIKLLWIAGGLGVVFYALNQGYFK